MRRFVQILSLITGIAVGSVAAPIYTVQALPVGGTCCTVPNAVNNAGQVTGIVEVANGNHQAFFWNGATMQLIPGEADWYLAQGSGINDAGQVVGTGFYLDGNNSVQSQTFVWSSATGPQLLPSNIGNANDINNAGQVTGYSQGWAVVYNGSTFNYPGQGTGVAISENGRVAIDNFGFAGYWNGSVVLPLGEWRPAGISASGVWVAGARTVSPSSSEAVFWSEATGLVPVGGLPNGLTSFATSVNNSGQVFGTTIMPNGESHGWVWQNGTFTDLRTLAVNVSGWSFLSPTAVSESGYITGVGNFNGDIRAFVLTPVASEVPEPNTWMLSAAGLAALALRRRNSRPF